MERLRLASTTWIFTLLYTAGLFLVSTAVTFNHTNGGAVLEDEIPLSRSAACTPPSEFQSCWGQTEVPEGGPWPEIKYLQIYDSNIQVLRDNVFYSFHNLHRVSVSDCNVESIETNAFSDLSTLVYVSIPKNKIQTVRSVKFPVGVEYLDVSKNHLDFSEASPFPESHPSLRRLHANDVGLAAFTSSLVQGFKALTSLYFTHNSLTSLNLQEFVGFENLVTIDVQHNALNSIIGLPAGVVLQSIKFLDVSYNNIGSLDVDLFKGLPALDELSLLGNPLTLSPSTPFLSHEFLSGIILSEVNAAALSSKTLESLPNLQVLEIDAAGVSDITGVFTKLTALRHLHLMNNNVESVKKGTFAAAGTLQTLILSHNPLREFDPAALDDVMKEGGTIDISHSPMACAKDYDDLSEWCSKNNVRLNAACKETTAPPGTAPPGTAPPGTSPPVKPPPVDDDCAADADCGEGFCCKNKECLEKGKCGVGIISALPFFVLLILAYFTLARELTL